MLQRPNLFLCSFALRFSVSLAVSYGIKHSPTCDSMKSVASTHKHASARNIYPNLYDLTFLPASPLRDQIVISYSTAQRNGSWIKETTYRGPASREVDAAWEELGTNCKYADILRPSGCCSIANLPPRQVCGCS